MPIVRVKLNHKLLEDWIKDRKYNISEFCKLIKVTRCAYYQYKKGVSPSEEIRSRMSYVTGISADKLFTKLIGVQKGRTPDNKMMNSDCRWNVDSKEIGGNI